MIEIKYKTVSSGTLGNMEDCDNIIFHQSEMRILQKSTNNNNLIGNTLFRAWIVVIYLGKLVGYWIVIMCHAIHPIDIIFWQAVGQRITWTLNGVGMSDKYSFEHWITI